MLRNVNLNSARTLVLAPAPGVPTPVFAENLSLVQQCPKDRLRSILLPVEKWQRFPKAGERAAWEQLPEDVRGMLITQAEAERKRYLAL